MSIIKREWNLCGCFTNIPEWVYFTVGVNQLSQREYSQGAVPTYRAFQAAMQYEKCEFREFTIGRNICLVFFWFFLRVLHSRESPNC